MGLGFLSLLILAFFGGLLSIASPCGGLLIPLFFANTFKNKNKFIINSLLFFLGSYLTAILITFGLFFVFLHLPFIPQVFKFLGVVFIIIGFFALFGKSMSINLPILKHTPKKGYLSSFLLGVFASVSHGACCGPILGLLATISLRLNNLFYSSILMFFYTLGLILPLILIGFGVEKIAFIKKVFVSGKPLSINTKYYKHQFHNSNIISFLFFVLSGLVLLFFNGSLFSFINFTKIDINFMLEYQDKLINFFYN